MWWHWAIGLGGFAIIAALAILEWHSEAVWLPKWRSRRRPPLLDPEVARCKDGRRHDLRLLPPRAHVLGDEYVRRWQCPRCLLLVREEPEASASIAADLGEMAVHVDDVNAKAGRLDAIGDEAETAMARAIEGLDEAPGVERAK